MTSLLDRQLRRFGGDASRPPEDWRGFLDAVEEAYRWAAQDRAMLERSMELASEELVASNQQLRQQMAERERVEAELRLAHKLESVGQLAAGVAHEINTPVQYIGDTVEFLKSACEAVQGYLAVVDEARGALIDEPAAQPILARVAQAEDDTDVTWLMQRAPEAIQRALDGVERVTSIVRAMREFAHPDRPEMAPADINRAVRTTLTVAQNEYKHCARVTLDLGELPAVTCHVGQVNQVLLNLVVNAAHAITDARRPEGTLGTIAIRTRQEGDSVVIDVADDGCGIPPDVRERVYDPFFTTKEVGRGSGQGLALARSIIVERHGGSLAFDTEVGVGTTFTFRLPVAGPAEGEGRAA